MDAINIFVGGKGKIYTDIATMWKSQLKNVPHIKLYFKNCENACTVNKSYRFHGRLFLCYYRFHHRNC